ncbi:MAG: hypothetical protein RL204_22, partial [Bacteroidota bacterium]
MRLLFLSIAFAFSMISYAQPDKIAEALYSTPAIVVAEEQVTVGDNLCSGFVSQVVSEDAQLDKYWKKYMKNSCGFSGKR